LPPTHKPSPNQLPHHPQHKPSLALPIPLRPIPHLSRSKHHLDHRVRKPPVRPTISSNQVIPIGHPAAAPQVPVPHPPHLPAHELAPGMPPAQLGLQPPGPTGLPPAV
ncbi:Isonitrile hydratase, partial [Cytospora mali]